MNSLVVFFIFIALLHERSRKFAVVTLLCNLPEFYFKQIIPYTVMYSTPTYRWTLFTMKKIPNEERMWKICASFICTGWSKLILVHCLIFTTISVKERIWVNILYGLRWLRNAGFSFLFSKNDIHSSSQTDGKLLYSISGIHIVLS